MTIIRVGFLSIVSRLHRLYWPFWCLCLLLTDCGDPIEQQVQGVMVGKEKREEALMELVFARTDALPVILAALEDTALPARGRADLVEILWRIYIRESDARIFPALSARTSDRTPEVRRAVFRTLADIGKKDAIPPVFAQLQVETDEEAQRQALIALEILDGWKIGRQEDTEFLSISGGESLSAEQRTLFTRILHRIYKGARSETLRDQAAELLEKIAAQKTQEGDQLVLRADVEGARQCYEEAVAIKPDSKAAVMRLGKFYFFYGDQRRGLEMLENNGMVIRARRLEEAPSIDGDLSDPVWSQASRVDRFYQTLQLMRAVPAEGVSEAYVGYMDSSIYIGIVGYEENTQDMIARYTVRDSDVYLDDCAEVFFDTNLDQQSFYQVVANSIGGMIDAHVRSPKNSDEAEARQWNGDQRVATRVEPGFWEFEMEMPFRSLGNVQVQPGDIWGFNVARVRIAFGGEYTQWMPTYGSAWRTDRFGLLVFD